MMADIEFDEDVAFDRSNVEIWFGVERISNTSRILLPSLCCNIVACSLTELCNGLGKLTSNLFQPSIGPNV